MKPFFIAVEGPIGVGKSTLAKAISEKYNFHLLNEIVSENPFLDSFYKDIDEWSFQTEMFFLVNRFKQLEEINEKFLQQNISVVSDYHIFKNLIFANRTLKKEHFDKYRQIFQILNEDLPQPNILIYLHANVETLLKRISKRGREFEKDIDPQYLENLCVDYDQYIKNYIEENPDKPVIKIDGNKYDFVENPEHLELIFYQLENLLKKGATIL